MFFLSALKTVRRTNIFLDEGLERVSAQQKKLVTATQYTLHQKNEVRKIDGKKKKKYHI